MKFVPAFVLAVVGLSSANVVPTGIEGITNKKRAEILKRNKYKSLGREYHFIPFGVETLGPWGPSAHKLFAEIAKHLVDVTGDRRAGGFLAQRISTAIQRGNAASILGTMPQGPFLDLSAQNCPAGTTLYSIPGCGYVTREATCRESRPRPDKQQLCGYIACHCSPPTVKNEATGQCVHLDKCPGAKIIHTHGHGGRPKIERRRVPQHQIPVPPTTQKVPAPVVPVPYNSGYTNYNSGYNNANTGYTNYNTAANNNGNSGYTNYNSGYRNINSGYRNYNTGYKNAVPVKY